MEQREKLSRLIAEHIGKTNLVDHLLANGVVVPVWCMECTHGKDDGTGIQCHKHNKQFGDYDFCSYGERRSNNK